MVTFDIDFDYNTSITIQEMLEQLGEEVTLHTENDTIIVKTLPTLKDSLKGKTLLSDCRLFAMLIHSFHYNHQVFTMGLSTDSVCDILLPQDGSLICMSLHNKLHLADKLRLSLDDQQSQWICRLPQDSLPEAKRQESHYIGLTSHGVKIMSITKWLEFYQAVVCQKIDQFHLKYQRGTKEQVSPYKTSCMGLLQIHKERYGSIPCGAYCPQAIYEAKEIAMVGQLQTDVEE